MRIVEYKYKMMNINISRSTERYVVEYKYTPRPKMKKKNAISMVENETMKEPENGKF